tara:strand:+ start:41 stop:496 length:456 start_codon:yes stop_codon:yes gene_type:complete
MTLKELQKMIKEELDSFVQNENVDEMSDKVDEVDVDVDTEAGDIDADAEGDDAGAEDMLRNIYDMLKDKFEGEEDLGDEEAPEDVEETYMEGEEADLEEAASTGFGDAGSKKTSGKDVGYTPAKTTKGDGKLHEEKTQLQERFQRLANIIK